MTALSINTVIGFLTGVWTYVVLEFADKALFVRLKDVILGVPVLQDMDLILHRKSGAPQIKMGYAK